MYVHQGIFVFRFLFTSFLVVSLYDFITKVSLYSWNCKYSLFHWKKFLEWLIFFPSLYLKWKLTVKSWTFLFGSFFINDSIFYICVSHVWIIHMGMCVCYMANPSNQLAPISVCGGWVYRSHAHSEFTWVPQANQHLHGFYMPSTALLFKRQAHSSLGQVPTALFAVFSLVSCFNLFGLSGFCFLLYQELALILWTKDGGFPMHVYNTF